MTFQPGEVEKTVSVNVQRDPFQEGNETLHLDLYEDAGAVPPVSCTNCDTS